MVGIGQYYTSNNCPSIDGCPDGVCPSLVLKRYDTNPAFRVAISDCDGVLDLDDPRLVLEVNMWSKAKLKKSITTTDTVVQFADNIGFNQIVVGDVLRFQRVRNPEFMQVVSINEDNYEITVTRAVEATTLSNWKRGTSIVIYRIKSAVASIETTTGDVIDATGSTLHNQLLDTNLLYQWNKSDTILPGCYWLEFKLLKIIPQVSSTFFNYSPVIEYSAGDPPILLTPNIMIINDDFVYPWCSFVLNPNSSIYEYFTINSPVNEDGTAISEMISVQAPVDGEGVITITPVFEDIDSVSVVPILDEGDTISTIPVLNEDDTIVSASQPGMVIITNGKIYFDGAVVAEFIAGQYNTPLTINFNNRATKIIVEQVLQNITFVDISSEPALWTRTFTYQLISGDSTASEIITFYLGINSMPNIQQLEGIEWIRRFPVDAEGFLIKVVDTNTAEQ